MARVPVLPKHYAEVFAGDIGEAVLEDILESGFVYSALPRNEPIDPHRSLLRDGARGLALGIRKAVHDGRRPTPPTPPAAHTTEDPRENA